jgi:anti-sigma factor ChrR (cupin superfamily)
MTNKHVFDLLPCYVLGVLDEAEMMLVSGHLSACAVCRKELESYTEIPSHLGIAATRLTPDAELKARVLCRIRSMPEQNASIPEPPTSNPEQLP